MMQTYVQETRTRTQVNGAVQYFLDRAEILVEHGAYADAEHQLTQCVQLMVATDSDESCLIQTLYELGLVCHAQCRYSLGQGYLLDALTRAERLLGKKHPEVREIRDALCELCDDRDTQFGLADRQH